MYHQATFMNRAYYDTMEEMPLKAEVYFPDEKEPKMMTVDEMLKLSNDGWYVIMRTCNYGVCDHWVSEPLEKWVRQKFMSIIQFVSKGATVGYNREGWSVRLTRDAHYWKSEVWNS